MSAKAESSIPRKIVYSYCRVVLPFRLGSLHSQLIFHDGVAFLGGLLNGVLSLLVSIDRGE